MGDTDLVGKKLRFPKATVDDADDDFYRDSSFLDSLNVTGS